MNVVLIYNPRSGKEYSIIELRKLFRKYDVNIRYSFTIEQLSSKKLRALIDEGWIIATVGGDGTLRAVARLLIHTPSTLLPLPGGTFNHFVRDLGMEPTLDATLARIQSGRSRRIDVAFCNDEMFLNNSNLGLYPFSLVERQVAKRIVGKYAAAVLSAFDQLRVFRRHRLVIDNKRLRSPFIFIGNNVFDIKTSLIPSRTSFSRGVLTVMIATSRSRIRLIKAIFAVIRGDVSRQPDFTLTQRPTCVIYSPHRQLVVSFDGEVKHMSPPLAYRSERRALNVLVVKALKT